MTQLEAFIALNMIDGIGSVRLESLLNHFGSAENIFGASADELMRISGIGPVIAESIRSFDRSRIDREISLIDKHGLKIVICRDNAYPTNLKEIPGFPIILYVKGELLPGDSISVAIVGSRRASFYGLSCAEKFAYSLARKGVTIVSGMARGVDTSVHKGALRAGGRTIAVIGSGFGNLYPPENLKLAEQIARSGAVVSEFAIGTLPLPQNFPRRNRLISGLSLGVLVAEAACNSGALITVDFALEQGREVFALPGKIDSGVSCGTNDLIKQGAKLVSCPEEILEELYLPLAARHVPLRLQEAFREREDRQYPQEEERIYDLMGNGQVCLDEVAEKTNIEIPRLLGILLKMQLNKRVRRLPGNYFAVC